MIVARIAAGTHAAFLVGAGAWPIVHRESFERITGRKREFWLVRLVGALAALTGTTLGIAVARGKQTPEAKTLALGSILVFGLADVHAARKHSRIYLADAVAQTALVPAWLVDWHDGSNGAAAPVRRRRLRFPFRQPDDATIQERVETAAELPEDVEVEVERGVVTMRGAVEDEQVAAELVDRISRERGVRGVDPRLAIGTP
jgi:BON domain